MSDMTWTRRLLALATGRGSDDISAQIGALRLGFLERADLFAKAAELAPHEAAEKELRHLSAEQAAACERIRAGSQEYGPAVPLTPASAESGTQGNNHWARLVRLLELHQRARDELREAGMGIADRHPALVPLFEDLANVVDAHLTRLRALIAQADPHALD